MNEWRDLADDELLARLVQHGATPGHAELLVTYRDEPSRAEAIDEIMSA